MQKDDTQITADDEKSANLILLGRSEQQPVPGQGEGQAAHRLDGRQRARRRQELHADHHVPVLIHPNPRAPRKYVVVNSSFTFREYDYLNNARQIPKLPIGPSWT